VLLAYLGLGRLLALAPTDLPRADVVGIDLRVLLASLGITLATGLAFGLVPLHQARRVDLQSTLREEGRSGSAGIAKQRFRSFLVVLEIALSVMLLVGAGLMIRSLRALQSVDPGFVSENLLKVEYVLPPSRYPQSFNDFPGWPEVHRFQREVQTRIAALPGVEAVGLTTQHPMREGFTNSFVIVGRESEQPDQPEIGTRMVSPDYFRTVGVPVIRGRTPDERDATEAPAVVAINEAAAERFFPGQDPIGQSLAFWGAQREIVGVVGNERFRGLGEDAPIALYAPLAQAPIASGSILVRTTVPPTSIAGAVRGAIREVDADLAVYAIATMDDEVRASVSRERFAATLLGLFAFTALLLAVIGVHGLLSYGVAQRTRELGIRMALGATSGEVVGMVVKKGLLLSGLGLGLGLVGAFSVTGLLRGMLFGVAATDPLTFAFVAAAMLGAALIACLAPARRATAADPMEALRAE
jgi:predicted permease